MSAAKRGARFSYLTGTGERLQTTWPAEEESEQETAADSAPQRDDSWTTTDSSGGGGEGRSHTATQEGLASVPKGKGRMRQERSQLNVRIPTVLKRQAAAKAVLEGRDIGEVVEELLREYLER